MNKLMITASHTPTVDELKTARTRFEESEPRDLFYRVATELIELALAGKTSITMAEALAVLLQTWNAAYYRFHAFNGKHVADIESLLHARLNTVLAFRGRQIDSVCGADMKAVQDLFESFEQVLHPVGAAKALHLLAPRFFPLWDREIARSYGCKLGPIGTNAIIYARFLLTTTLQVRELSPIVEPGTNLLKAIDEYNYCKFTKSWTE